MDINDVIKPRNRDPNAIYFILTGRISVYDPCWNSDQVVLANHYWPGQSVCDPEQNQSASYFSKVKVTSDEPAKVFYMSHHTYMQIYIDKLNQLRENRMKEVAANFQIFAEWEYQRLKNLLFEVKERILDKGECLCRESQELNFIFLLVKGKLRVEKEIDINDKNYWPTGNHSWCEKKIVSHVLFKIQEMTPYTTFGERECLY